MAWPVARSAGRNTVEELRHFPRANNEQFQAAVMFFAFWLKDTRPKKMTHFFKVKRNSMVISVAIRVMNVIYCG
jgi:hypothetical protein